MSYQTILAQLEALGNEQTRKIYKNHGAQGSMFGVKVGDLKKLLKGHKNDQALANQLFETGNIDAQYLAALMGNPKTVTPETLDKWVEQARFYMVSEYGVAGLAAESPHGWELGLKWIESPLEHVRSAGWATLAGVVAYWPNESCDLRKAEALLLRIANTLADELNRVRYSMNSFVMCVGGYISALTEKALETADQLGKVHVDMGGTACKVPDARQMITKMDQMGKIGQKKKHVRC